MNQIKLSHEENITSGLNGLKKERDFYQDRTQTLQARLDLLIAWYESNPQISDTWINQCIQDWRNNQVYNIQESLLSTDYVVEGIKTKNSNAKVK
jgi:hypothetical protein